MVLEVMKMTKVFEHDFEKNLEQHEEKKTIEDILNEVSRYMKKQENLDKNPRNL